MSTSDQNVHARPLLGSITAGIANRLRAEREFGETDWPRGPVSAQAGPVAALGTARSTHLDTQRSNQGQTRRTDGFNVEAAPGGNRTPTTPSRPDARSATLIEPIRTDLFRDVSRGVEGLDAVRQELGDCRRCKLHTGRKNLVFGVGNPNAELMFVGEGPGADEDAQGIPFVGKAGQLLTRQIEAMGYKRDDVYIANIVKCRPPNNRDPEPDERLACGPYVLGQIRAVSPKAIIALGRVATQALLETNAPIGTTRGKWFTHPHVPVPVMPTYHPAALLRADNLRRYVWEDLKQVMTFLGKPIPGR